MVEVAVHNEYDGQTTSANRLAWKSTMQQEWSKTEFGGEDFNAPLTLHVKDGTRRNDSVQYHIDGSRGVN